MNRDPSFQIYPVDGSNCQVLFRGRQCGVILPTAGLCSPSKILPSTKKNDRQKTSGGKNLEAPVTYVILVRNFTLNSIKVSICYASVRDLFPNYLETIIFYELFENLFPNYLRTIIFHFYELIEDTLYKSKIYHSVSC